jgi:uncharacterized protein
MTTMMTCPKCRGTMTSYERNGVLVDQCGDCRGLFLDRGELEQLTNAETAWYGAPERPRAAPAEHGGQYRQPHKRKRRSFLEDLFD